MGSKMPPMVSAEILHYDDREGLNEEQAAIVSGREMIVSRQLEGTRPSNVDVYSDSGLLGILWDHELILVNEGQSAPPSTNRNC